MKTKIIYIIATLLIFFGTAFRISVPDYSIFSDRNAKLLVTFEGIQPALAANAQWAGVRAVATFTKNVVSGVDSLISAIATSGLLTQTQSVQYNNGTYKFLFNPAFNSAITSTAFGSKTYQYSFIIWKSSDNSKVLELFFDNPSSKSEVLAIWQPNKYDPTLSTLRNPLMECAMTGGAANGYMVCSWNGGPFANGADIIDSGRIKMKANSAAGTVSFKGIGRLKTGTNPCSAGDYDYYAIAFIAKSVTPFYTTARWGLANEPAGAMPGSACGSSSAAFIQNDAYFNVTSNPGASDDTKYFVQDGVTSDLDPNYPTVASVNTLFAEINQTDADSVNMAQGTLDAVNVIFRGQASPGF